MWQHAVRQNVVANEDSVQSGVGTEPQLEKSVAVGVNVIRLITRVLFEDCPAATDEAW